MFRSKVPYCIMLETSNVLHISIMVVVAHIYIYRELSSIYCCAPCVIQKKRIIWIYTYKGLNSSQLAFYMPLKDLKTNHWRFLCEETNWPFSKTKLFFFGSQFYISPFYHINPGNPSKTPYIFLLTPNSSITSLLFPIGSLN